jgi:phenylacetate-CoA ligase
MRLDLATPAQLQLEWLERQGPLYLNTFPSNLRALALAQIDRPRNVDVGAVVTVGEPVTGDLRDLAREAFDCEIWDNYSSTEGLMIAGQCPDSTSLHVQSELVKLEILKSDGSPAGLGEEGDVVVTPLVNFAMPLVRYRLEDRAAWRGVCGCGRGHPLISVEVGRERHLFQFEDGSTVFPMIRTREFMDYLNATRWQVAQTSTRSVEIRFSSSRGADHHDYAAMKDAVRAHLAHEVDVQFRLMEAWPATESGKLPEYIREF